MKLTGVTLIRNGNLLKYPWKLCVNNLYFICDETWINCDPSSEDNTFGDLKSLTKNRDNTNIFSSIWNMSNTGDGRELANQINIMLPLIETDWLLYLQADELIHEKDKDIIRNFLTAIPSSMTQVELYRTYFWKDLKHRVPKYEIWLGRIFKSRTHIIGGDGMHLIRQSGEVARLEIPIYHYSRIGTEKEITYRIRTLDGFFHDQEEIKSYKDFKYTEVNQNEITPFIGSHPYGVNYFYEKRY